MKSVQLRFSFTSVLFFIGCKCKETKLFINIMPQFLINRHVLKLMMLEMEMEKNVLSIVLEKVSILHVVATCRYHRYNGRNQYCIGSPGLLNSHETIALQSG